MKVVEKRLLKRGNRDRGNWNGGNWLGCNWAENNWKGANWNRVNWKEVNKMMKNCSINKSKSIGLGFSPFSHDEKNGIGFSQMIINGELWWKILAKANKTQSILPPAKAGVNWLGGNWAENNWAGVNWFWDNWKRGK